jgi:YggT family protein
VAPSLARLAPARRVRRGRRVGRSRLAASRPRRASALRGWQRLSAHAGLAGDGRPDYVAGNRTSNISGEPMGSLVQILLFIINIVWFIVIAHVIMSWLIGFNVLNRHQPLVWQIWNGLERLLEPIYGPIRRVLPNMGGLDLSPLVLIVILYALQTIIVRNAVYFY